MLRFWSVCSKRLSEPASVPPVRSKRLFERAVRDRCSQKLFSVTLCSEPLYSAMLRSVHGYARVHTSMYNICANVTVTDPLFSAPQPHPPHKLPLLPYFAAHSQMHAPPISNKSFSLTLGLNVSIPCILAKEPLSFFGHICITQEAGEKEKMKERATCQICQNGNSTR